ncbi:MAG: pilin, type IV [Acidobacteria bacterium]|nr:pilin, type IV [Acidobacteriota bacterium]
MGFKIAGAVLLALTILALTIPIHTGHRMYPHEMAAIRSITHINTAQSEYLAAHGRYADNLAALGFAELITGNRAGYQFRFETTPAGYTISASPASAKTGRRTFFSDQSFVLRENWGPEPATPQSKVLK